MGELDDADLAIAVNAAINGAYLAIGLRCTASSRPVVTESIHYRFVAAMVHLPAAGADYRVPFGDRKTSS